MFPMVGFTWLYESEEFDELANVYISIDIVETVWRLYDKLEIPQNRIWRYTTKIYFTNKYFYYGTPGHLL